MNETLQSIVDESEQAQAKYGSPASAHEALGVLMEEFDELKSAIHANKSASVEHEAIQVASVAYRLALAVASGESSFWIRSGFTTKP